MMNHLFLRVRGSDIHLKILALIIQLLLKSKSQKGTPLMTPQQVGGIMTEHPLFAFEFDNHIFYDLSRFSLVDMKNECMINDA